MSEKLLSGSAKRRVAIGLGSMVALMAPALAQAKPNGGAGIGPIRNSGGVGLTAPKHHLTLLQKAEKREAQKIKNDASVEASVGIYTSVIDGSTLQDPVLFYAGKKAVLGQVVLGKRDRQHHTLALDTSVKAVPDSYQAFNTTATTQNVHLFYEQDEAMADFTFTGTSTNTVAMPVGVLQR